MKSRRAAVIIGGGPSGAMLAALLARAGREVVVLERERAPAHKVCGEFISYEAQLYLADLGLDLRALGAVQVEQVRLFTRDAHAQAPLPFRALSLSRRAMDEAMLACAQDQGAEIRRGVRVTTLTREDHVWTVGADAAVILADDVFLATGKHDLRDWKRPAGLQSDLIGFKMHLALSAAQTAALDGAVELHLFPGGYAGLERIERGEANLCLLVRHTEFERMGRSWEGLISVLQQSCPILAQRLAAAQPCFPRPLAVSHIPYGYVRRRADGLWRLGDQAAVIPSFAGDGMSIAMHSAKLAAETYLAGGNADAFQRRLCRDVGAQVFRSTLASLALVRPGLHAAIGAVAQAHPSLLTAVARATRIPAASIQSTVTPRLGGGGVGGDVPAASDQLNQPLSRGLQIGPRRFAEREMHRDDHADHRVELADSP